MVGCFAQSKLSHLGAALARALSVAVVLSCCAISTIAQTAPPAFTLREGTLYVDQTAQRDNAQSLDSGGGPVPRSVTSGGFVLAADLTDPGYSAAVRLSGMAISSNSGTSTTARVNQLSLSVPVADDCFVSVGKRIVAWDVSYFVQPVGFFQNVPRIGDLEDRRGLLEGLPLGFAGCSVESGFTYQLVASAASGSSVERPAQAAARIAGTAGTMNYSLLLHHSERGATGLGWTLSSLLSDSVEVHSSGLLDIERQSANDRAIEALIGMNWNPIPTVSFVFEAWHNHSGLTNAEWDSLWQPIPSDPRAFERLRALTASGSYLRRNYVAARASSPLSAEVAFSPSVGFIYGADDASALCFLNLQYQINGRLLAMLGASRFVGKTQSEFGSARTRSEITLSLFGFF